MRGRTSGQPKVLKHIGDVDTVDKQVRVRRAGRSRRKEGVGWGPRRERSRSYGGGG